MSEGGGAGRVGRKGEEQWEIRRGHGARGAKEVLKWMGMVEGIDWWGGRDVQGVNENMR